MGQEFLRTEEREGYGLAMSEQEDEGGGGSGAEESTKIKREQSLMPKDLLNKHSDSEAQ